MGKQRGQIIGKSKQALLAGDHRQDHAVGQMCIRDSGYCAGKEILNYLMTGKRPEERKKLVEAHILIEESVNDAPC